MSTGTFSAAGLTVQNLLDEVILDVPHNRGSAFERGLLGGGIGTTLFYLTIGRTGTVSDVEFIQFHPTMLFDGHAGGRRPLITEAIRGEGATLVDARGDELGELLMLGMIETVFTAALLQIDKQGGEGSIEQRMSVSPW